MRVLLISEGVSELGGSLQAFVRRLLNLDEILAESIRISDPGLRASQGKGPGYFKKAIRCMLYAEERGFDAVVIVIDQDNQTERHRQFSDGQDHRSTTTFPRALGVAVRTFDAWMLADETALTAVLRRQVPTQPNPEEMKNPKAVIDELREQGSFEESRSAFYKVLAGMIDLSILDRRCPEGFRPFAARVRLLHAAADATSKA